MGKWNYILRFGKNLREAIEAEDIEAVAKCLIVCYRELLNKLSDEDKDWFESDIEEVIEEINNFVDCINRIGIEDEDQDELDDYLEYFYSLCDNVGAWVAT